ncbi:MAG: VanW family protein, partial [Actinomycetota bacterium]|nr:VanW family protein [Actinomycetota bacterium]
MHKNSGEPRAVGKRDRRAAKTKSPYTARKRRNRRNALLLLIVGALLALGVAVDYLANEGEILQAVRLGGTEESGETETAASNQEAVEEGGAAGEGAVVEDPAPTILLGEYFTDSAWDPDPGRQSNLRMAAQAIDETVLAPGEEFSALEVLSPLDYEPAKVFTDGGVAYEEGGGLCQISSTLYMAANYAGLEITERNPHYAELNYIQPGFDATVWFGTNGWGALDMRFRNNTDGDI